MLFDQNQKTERETRTFLTRLLVLVIFGLAGVSVLVMRLHNLTVVHGEEYHWDAVNIKGIREKDIPAQRGNIFDRHGKPLAVNEPGFDLFIKRFTKDKKKMADMIESIRVLYPNLDPVQATSVTALSNSESRMPLATGLTIEQVTPLMERQPILEGLYFEPTFRRVYPHGRAAGAIVGYSGQIHAATADEYEKQGYDKYVDRVGLAGTERSFEQFLRGEKGRMKATVSANERVLSSEPIEDSIPGGDITLTIDIDLQTFISDMLDDLTVYKKSVKQHDDGTRETIYVLDDNGNKTTFTSESQGKAAVVVMDPRNGEILSMVSKPDYDSNRPNAPGSSQYHHALRGHYWPGSTFKLVTATAWLTHRKDSSPHREITCDKKYVYAQDANGPVDVKCMYPHGTLDLYSAIEKSCNYYFYTLADKDLTNEELMSTARDFGFGEPPGIELQAFGLAGQVGFAKPGRTIYKIDRIRLGIGQGDLLRVTPLQMASAYSAMANGGTRYETHIVKRREPPNGRPIETEPVVASTIPWTPEQREILHTGLKRVTAATWGTARNVFDAKRKVAGKTGTTQSPRYNVKSMTNSENAWFIGYAPWDAPEICIAVMVIGNGHGGDGAAPFANQILEEYYRLKTLREHSASPVSVAPPSGKTTETLEAMPDTITKEAEETSKTLEAPAD